MSEDSIKMKPFSGKEEDWTLWSNQFLAKANQKGYRGILEGTDSVPGDGITFDETTDVGKKKSKLKEANKAGYSDLMALMGKSKMALLTVSKSRSNGLPYGDLRMAWKNLKERYQPTDDQTAQEVIETYNNCVLEPSQDPEDWIAEKDELRTRLQMDFKKKDYEDNDFKLSIIAGLPEEYHAEKVALKESYKKMQITQIITYLRDRYKELKSDKNGSNKKEEKALHTKERTSNGNGKKRFMGKCFHCGKFGHRKEDCREKNNGKPDAIQPGRFNGNRGGNGPRFRGKCGYCGKAGHQDKDCFKKKADEEKANAAEEDSDDSDERAMTMVECIDCTQEEEDDFELEPISDSDTETDDETEEPDEIDGYKLFKPGMYVRFYDTDDEDEDEDYEPLTVKKNHCTSCESHGHYRSKCVQAVQRVHLNRTEDYEDSSVEDHDDSTVEGSEAEIDYEPKSTNPIEEKIENTLDGIQTEKIQIECKTKSKIQENLKFHGAKENTADVPHGTGEPHGTDPEKAFKIGTGKADRKHHGDQQLFIADTGATCHLKTTRHGLTNVRKVNKQVRMGKSTVQIDFIGDLEATVEQVDGSRSTILVKDIRVAPEAGCNLLSLTRLLQRGFALHGDNKGLRVTKGKTVITFDRTMEAGSGYLLGVRLIPKTTDEVASLTLNEGSKVKYKDLHGMLGHPGAEAVRMTAKTLGLDVTGKTDKCEDCTMAKMRQKNIPKDNENKSSVPGERLYIDTSRVKAVSYGGSKFWSLAVDEATDQPFSDFIARKSQVPEKIVRLVYELKDKGKRVKYIRCDNAGENYKLQEECERRQLGIEFEFTAPDTPQQNGVVERKFATLFGRGRAMLNEAGIKGRRRQGLWAEAARTATLLDSITTKPGETTSPCKKFFGKLPKWIRHLRTFGEVGIVKDSAKIKGKMENKGRPAVFVGYPKDHAGNVYRFFTLDKESIVLSRDVQWMQKTWAQYTGKEDEDESDCESEEDVPGLGVGDTVNPNQGDEPEDDSDEEEDPVPKVSGTGRASSRLERELRKLDTEYNPTVDRSEDKEEDSEEPEGPEEASIAMELAFLAVLSGAMDPTRFKDAYDASDPVDRKGWRGGIRKEFNDMKKRKVWKKMKKKNIPPGIVLLGNKWVFKKKKNGVYRARLVAKGYDQVPGVDFTENFAPVINDVTIRVMIVLLLLKPHWIAYIVDVETAFLYGDMDVELYMEIPEGMELFEEVNPEEDCLLLLKTIYGTVQAARQWWKYFIKQLEEKLGFIRSKIDPCLLSRVTEEGTVVLCIYVDDACCFGDPKAVYKAKEEIAELFSVKDIGPMEEYVGVTVDRKNESIYLSQPDIIQRLDRYFGREVSGLKEFKTPLPAHYHIVRPEEGTRVLSRQEMLKYRSGTGSLLYLAKHTRIDIGNAVRELSKVMDKATEGHMKELLRCIRYVLLTQNRKLQYKASRMEPITITAICDSDYAGDIETRKSVTGYIIYINGCPVAWKSRQQKVTSLSSCESEYYAITEAATELLYIKQVFDFLGISVQLPMTIKGDNQGAIFLAKNESSTRTKHVDVRYHFIRDLVEAGTIKIEYVNTKENVADALTKNLPQEQLEKLLGDHFEDPSLKRVRFNVESEARSTHPG